VFFGVQRVLLVTPVKPYPTLHGKLSLLNQKSTKASAQWFRSVFGGIYVVEDYSSLYPKDPAGRIGLLAAK
jgi:hypothetical protein